MLALFSDDRLDASGTATSFAGPPQNPPGAWCARWITIFMAVGIAVRLIRYLLRFPLWGDEAMLAMNFLDRDYAGLLRPLSFHQVSPLLFLWTEMTAVKLLGFNEWSLRLFPLLSGIASLFLFRRLAALLLRGSALVLAIGIFAVTYSGIRYSAEMKPYSVDLMASTLLVWMAVRWWQEPEKTRRLWALAAVVPAVLGFSYPAVFVAGGVSAALAAVLLGTKSRRGWWAWGAYNFALAGAFLTWYRLAAGTQAGAELNVMSRMWENAFPPHDSLTSLLAWLVQVHTGPVLAVPLGGDHWGSLGTTLLCLAAVVALVMKGDYRFLVLCSAPFALNLLAAALRLFPYGGHMRLAMHLAPLVALLAGIGAAVACEWLRTWALPALRRAWLRLGGALGRRTPAAAEIAAGPCWDLLSRPVKVIFGLLLLVTAISTARDFYHPGKEQQEIRKRDFAVWFWGSLEREHEVVCIKTDLKEGFVPPDANWENCVSPQFLCNERIYSPRHAAGRPYDLSRVSRQRPLTCVQYWSHCAPFDRAAFNRWLEAMKQRYDLVATERYPMPQGNDDDPLREPSDWVELYEMAPKQETACLEKVRR